VTSAPPEPVLPPRPEQERRPIPWRVIWASIGSVILAAVGLLLVTHLARVIVWVVIAAFLAVVLNPAVDLLVGRFRLRRGLATTIVFVLGIALLAGLIAAFVTPLVTEGQKFAEAAPGYVAEAREGRGPAGDLVRRFDLDARLERSQETLSGSFERLGSQSVKILGTVGTAIAGTLTVLVVAFLLLLEAPSMMTNGLGYLSDERRRRVSKVATDCARAVTGYMAGNLVISVVAGALAYVFLLILGVPFRGVLALFVGFVDLIPLVGATLGAVVVIAVAFLHSTTAGIAAVVFFVIYQQFENHVLQPLVQSRTVHLRPLTVLLSVIVGVELAGILGALLAIPAAGIVQVVARDVWDNRRGRIKDTPTVGVDEQPVDA
jgi:predicted PurR-regulated permease PerM